MLASVMFDLRPIGGDETLFGDLQAETLAACGLELDLRGAYGVELSQAQPPLGLFRGFATVRSGEHKNTIDMKHSGVVPVVDLGRVYAPQGQIPDANTRARLQAAIEAGTVSTSGGRDLLDAYDLIAELRLEHQARRSNAATNPTTSWPRPSSAISSAATFAMPSWSSKPCNRPPVPARLLSPPSRGPAIGMALRHFSGKRLPKGIIPVGAGLGMLIGHRVAAEYGWAPKAANRPPWPRIW
jgi:hypothetical protein